MKDEKVIVLCKNCHVKEGSTIFEEFKELINQQDLFKKIPEEIDKFLDNTIIKHPKSQKRLKKDKLYKPRMKYVIKKLIKKRYIIEKLFNGECIGCGEITVENNLPSLGFHHKSASKKEKVIKWDFISKYKLNKIADLLIKEDCTCLCTSCHVLIHSINFEKFIEEILGERYSNLTNKVRSLYKEIFNNIHNYKIIGDGIKKEINNLF